MAFNNSLNALRSIIIHFPKCEMEQEEGKECKSVQILNDVVKFSLPDYYLLARLQSHLKCNTWGKKLE